MAQSDSKPGSRPKLNLAPVDAVNQEGEGMLAASQRFMSDLSQRILSPVRSPPDGQDGAAASSAGLDVDIATAASKSSGADSATATHPPAPPDQLPPTVPKNEFRLAPERRRAISKALWQKALLIVAEEEQKDILNMLHENRKMLAAERTRPKSRGFFGRVSASFLSTLANAFAAFDGEIIGEAGLLSDEAGLQAQIKRSVEREARLVKELAAYRSAKKMKTAATAFQEAGARNRTRKEEAPPTQKALDA